MQVPDGPFLTWAPCPTPCARRPLMQPTASAPGAALAHVRCADDGLDDRHCRYLHRLLTRHTLLYTGDGPPGHRPGGGTGAAPALQRRRTPRGPATGRQRARQPLAQAARLGEQWGYDEINLNCGCPSDRVQRGAFGASLMKSPLGGRLREGHGGRGAGARDGQAPHWYRQGGKLRFLRDFIGTVQDAGCRCSSCMRAMPGCKASLPRENRDIPPPRYEVVHRLKQDFPHLTIAINGGICTDEVVQEQLQHVDGVMVGREAPQPWWLARWDSLATAHPNAS